MPRYVASTTSTATGRAQQTLGRASRRGTVRTRRPARSAATLMQEREHAARGDTCLSRRGAGLGRARCQARSRVTADVTACWCSGDSISPVSKPAEGLFGGESSPHGRGSPVGQVGLKARLGYGSVVVVVPDVCQRTEDAMEVFRCVDIGATRARCGFRAEEHSVWLAFATRSEELAWSELSMNRMIMVLKWREERSCVY